MKQVRFRSYELQDRVSVSVDKEGVPVLFRKGNSESTALTLCNLRVGDCKFPAGAIVDIRDNDETNEPVHTTYSELDGRRERLDVYELPDDFTAAPARLSPWAFNDPLDRAIFGVLGNLDRVSSKLKFRRTTSFNANRTDIAARYTIGGFREAANQVLVLCDADLPMTV